MTLRKLTRKLCINYTIFTFYKSAPFCLCQVKYKWSRDNNFAPEVSLHFHWPSWDMIRLYLRCWGAIYKQIIRFKHWNRSLCLGSFTFRNSCHLGICKWNHRAWQSEVGKFWYVFTARNKKKRNSKLILMLVTIYMLLVSTALFLLEPHSKWAFQAVAVEEKCLTAAQKHKQGVCINGNSK